MDVKAFIAAAMKSWAENELLDALGYAVPDQVQVDASAAPLEAWVTVRNSGAARTFRIRVSEVM